VRYALIEGQGRHTGLAGDGRGACLRAHCPGFGVRIAWPYATQMTDTAKSSKPVIGLTGGVGSGKSLVASQLRELGCGVIDADQLAHATLALPDVHRAVTDMLGQEVLDADGNIDRGLIGPMVFDHPQRLTQLEEIVHPHVHAGRQRLREQYQRDPAVVAIVEDCPLLLEAGIASSCDALVFVAADEQVRLKRVAQSRGWDADELARRQKNQLALDIKGQRADHVIDNNADPAHCQDQVRRVLSDVLHADSK
jgi:dephospho-CoA kinase